MRHPHAQIRLIVVQDQHQPCPYVDGATARMPLRLPVGHVTPEVTDRLLAMGFRRSGDFVYRTQCPMCDECKPTRVDVANFQPTKSMRRVKNRGDRELICHWGPPTIDAQRIKLFNRHRRHRKLGDESIDAKSYQSFLTDSCCDTRELSILHGDDLVAVSIIDVGRTSSSAVYTHFDPAASRYSLGTYAILQQIDWAKRTGRKWVYLGMYVADNQHLNYKARYRPQQRLRCGQWIDATEPLPAMQV